MPRAALAAALLLCGQPTCSCQQAGTPCEESDDCPASQVCAEGLCRIACNSAADCSGDEVCFEGACLPERVAHRPDAATADTLPADGPTRDTPATDAPTADAPTADAPAADGAIADAHVPDAPTTDGATADAQIPDALTADAATADVPTADASTADAPTADAPPADLLASDGAAADTAVAVDPILLAVHPPIAKAGDIVFLEGTFPPGTSAQVHFARAAAVSFTLSATVHRLAVPVPQGAGSGPLRVEIDGRASGTVPFRYTTFAPKLGAFSRHYEQTVAARELPRLDDWRTRFSALVLGRWLYLIGGRIANNPETFIQRARVYADGTLSPFEAVAASLNTRRVAPAVAVAGDRLYVVGGEDPSRGGDGQLASYETSAFTPDGDVGAFVQHEGGLDTPRMDAAAVVIGPYLYVLGGRSCDDYTTCVLRSVERAAIRADGSLAPFTVQGDLMSEPRDRFAIEVVGEALYLFGGTSARDTYEQLYIEESGALTPPPNAPSQLAVSVRALASVRLGDQVCLIGGEDDLVQCVSSVQCAEIGAGDQLGAWSVRQLLAEPRAEHAVALAGNRLYAIAGRGAGYLETDALQQAAIHDGATFGPFVETVAPLPVARRGPACVIIGDRLFVTGGYDGEAPDLPELISDEIWTALIDADGALGSFTTTQVTLDQPRWVHRLALAGNVLYALGGWTATGASAQVAVSQISAHATIGTFATAAPMPTSHSTFGAAIANGRIYVAGGMGSCSTCVASHTLPVDSSSWSMEEPLAVTRALTSSAVIGDAFYLVGGSAYSAPYTTLVRSSLGSELLDFEGVSPQLLTGREVPALLVLGGSLWVLGGHGDGSLASGERIAIAGDGSLAGSFEDTEAVLPQEQGHLGCLVELGNYVHVLGGWDGSALSDSHFAAEIVTP